MAIKTRMTIYDNDLPPGFTKDSYLVNPYGSKSDGTMFNDPELNKAYGPMGGGGGYGGTVTTGIYYGSAGTGKPWPRWGTALMLVLLAFAILAYGRHVLVVERLSPYPPSDYVVFAGESLGSNPTAKSVAEKYKTRLWLFQNQMAPLFPATAPWNNFYSGCGMSVRCITHPMEVVDRFRKHALAPDTFWNDLCNLSNFHRDDFPTGVPLEWDIKTKVHGAGSLHPTTYSQCQLKADSLAQVQRQISASRERRLLMGNGLFAAIALMVMVGVWAWFRGGLPKLSRAGRDAEENGGASAGYMAKLASHPKLEQWSEGDRRIVCGNRQFMAAAIQKYPQNYQYGSEDVRSDVEIARSAIAGYFLSIQYVPESIQGNPDLVILACQKQAWHGFEYASEQLRGDPDFMLKVLALSQYAGLLRHATPSLLANEAFLRKALKISANVLEYCTDKMKDDYELIKSIISREESGLQLQHASQRLRGRKELVLLAYQNPGDFISLYEELSPELQKDAEVIEAAKKAMDLHFS